MVPAAEGDDQAAIRRDFRLVARIERRGCVQLLDNGRSTQHHARPQVGALIDWHRPRLMIRQEPDIAGLAWAGQRWSLLRDRQHRRFMVKRSAGGEAQGHDFYGIVWVMVTV